MTMGDSFLKCPVTALHIYKAHVLSGHGSKVVLYSMETCKRVLSRKLFHGKRLHKFCESKVCEGDFAVVAGDTVKCIAVKEDGNMEMGLQRVMKDWVWDCFWCSAKEIMMITAHNTVIMWNIETNCTKLVASCRQQCILYSATFALIHQQVHVAVGTVFNQVLLWTPKTNNVGQHEFIESYKTFLGHQGVIFRIRFHPHRKAEFLSVSDDRSIRMWHMEKEQCLRVMYGHTARVWDAQYLHESIVSIGEDAFCLMWSKEGFIHRKFSGHKGKSIWSLAVGDKQIVTGGGDCSIRLYNASDSPHTSSVELMLPANEESKKEDFPRDVKIIDLDTLLIVTNEGHLWNYSTSPPRWNLVQSDARFRSYCTVDVACNKIALGSLDGLVKIILPDFEIEAQTFCGKVYNIKWLQSDKRDDFLLCCGPEGETKLFRLHVNRLVLTHTVVLPYSRQRWITAACFAGEMLVAGDRRGSLHLFDMKNEAPVYSSLGVHGKTGVTRVLGYKQSVYTTGRDGTYRQLQIKNAELFLMDRQKVCKGMEWIEGIWCEDCDIVVYGFYMQSYFAAWSHKKNEMLFKIKCGGGYRAWHLSCTELNVNGAKSFLFCYLKGASIHAVNGRLHEGSQGRVLEESLHGREINCVKVIARNATQGSFILATCSEDTTIDFQLYSSRLQTSRHLHRSVGHIGGVKDLSYVSTSSNDGLLFSCGSRSSLKCWSLRHTDEHHLTCSLTAEVYSRETRKKRESNSPTDDLRFLSCSAQQLSDVTNHFVCTCACSDGVARVYLYGKCKFQQLAILDCHNHCVQNVMHLFGVRKFCIFTTSTDGCVAIWDIHEPLCDYLKSANLENDNPSNSRFRIHDFGAPLLGVVTLKRKLLLHQSGVNSLDCRWSGQGVELVTGGDDNALCFTRLDGNFETIAQFKNPYAHFSQITGVRFVNETYCMSTSVDQRIAIWCLQANQLLRIFERLVDICDISCLEHWLEEDKVHVAVGGVGLEIITVDFNNVNNDESKNIF